MLMLLVGSSNDLLGIRDGQCRQDKRHMNHGLPEQSFLIIRGSVDKGLQ